MNRITIEKETHDVEMPHLTSFLVIGINSEGDIMTDSVIDNPTKNWIKMCKPMVRELLIALDTDDEIRYLSLREIAEKLEWGVEKTRKSLKDLPFRRRSDNTKMYSVGDLKKKFDTI